MGGSRGGSCGLSDFCRTVRLKRKPWQQSKQHYYNEIVIYYKYCLQITSQLQVTVQNCVEIRAISVSPQQMNEELVLGDLMLVPLQCL